MSLEPGAKHLDSKTKEKEPSPRRQPSVAGSVYLYVIQPCTGQKQRIWSFVNGLKGR